ncbi:DUF6174 domain-containing protein [Streptomyces sp. HM190]|uniref:DUF6174 domain-containing protein n=1 Tax=Streptomyces sp. HM190 TaxID=2695266 RepID=UPI00135C5E17|nr:DUF6174 domain-containing protein [Streptomyces sp. HM190]
MSRTRISRPAVAVLAVAVSGVVAACGGGSSSQTASARPSWREPSSYTYTLTSSEGERSLLGTFEVTVRDGKVTRVVGADEDSRRVARQLSGRVPTIGDLLAEADAARDEGADLVDVDRAADGRPTRVLLDWEEDAVDDEAVYGISDYRPSAAPGRDGR